MKTNEKEITSEQSPIDTIFPVKVSLSALRLIWDDEQQSYTDEELAKIREWLYIVANIVIAVGKRLEKEHTITHQNKIYEHKIPQSYSLCESEYRRAS